jgi:ankyrin repeat protein
MVTALLDAGAKVNVVELKSGATPLYEAASLGRLEVVSLLVTRGADPNLADKAGHGALFAAASNGFEETAAWLRAHGAGSDKR